MKSPASILASKRRSSSASSSERTALRSSLGAVSMAWVYILGAPWWTRYSMSLRAGGGHTAFGERGRAAKSPSAAQEAGAHPPFAAAAGACSGCLWERREAQGRGRRAQRASKTDSPQLSERSAHGARSEFCGATLPRASQRSRPSGRPLPLAARAGPRCSGAQETDTDSDAIASLTSAAYRSPAGLCPASVRCRPAPAHPHACSRRSAS